MFTEMQCSSGGGSGDISTTTLISSPSGTDYTVVGETINVTQGKIYAISGIIPSSGVIGYAVSGGELLGSYRSNSDVTGSCTGRSILLIIKATSNTITITTSPSSYSALWAYNVVELG